MVIAPRLEAPSGTMWNAYQKLRSRGRGREDARAGAPLHLRGDQPAEDRLPRRGDGGARAADQRLHGQEGAGQGPAGRMGLKSALRLRDNCLLT